jgi:superkiller protein 3
MENRRGRSLPALLLLRLCKWAEYRTRFADHFFPIFPGYAEDIIKIVPTPKFQKEAPLTTLEIIAVAIHSYLAQISLYSLSQTTNSGAWYDLSVALQSWIKKAPSLADIFSAKDKVVEYLKKALQLDPANHSYWVGLGNAYFLPHAKAAQHAYINPSTWVKLGLTVPLSRRCRVGK